MTESIRGGESNIIHDLGIQHPELRTALEPPYVGELLGKLRSYSSWTYEHTVRTGVLTARLLNVLQPPPANSLTIIRAAILHDVGKIGVPLEILDKSEPLRDSEFEQIEPHPLYGFGMTILTDPEVAKIIVGHHEHQGDHSYPRRSPRPEKTDSQILFAQRLIAVADTVDSLINPRPYKEPWDQERIFRELQDRFGGFFPDSFLQQSITIGMGISERR